MQFIKPDINLDFIGKRKIAFAFSIVLIIAALASLVVHGGPKYGIDFAGGMEVRLKFSKPVTSEQIRDALRPVGLDRSVIQQSGASDANEFSIRADVSHMQAQNAWDILMRTSQDVEPSVVMAAMTSSGLGDFELAQTTDNGRAAYLIRTTLVKDDEQKAKNAAQDLRAALLKNIDAMIEVKPQFTGASGRVIQAVTDAIDPDVEMRSVEMVGPQVGQALREKALSAMFFALLFITVYISGRFELKWVTGALMACILLGAMYVLNVFHLGLAILMVAALIISIICFYLLQLRFAMGAIVALLHDVCVTVGVFSVFNMEFSLPIIAALLTIIGYSLNDTIVVFDRIRENSKKMARQPLERVINRSVNETFSRTILTSLTTLIVVLCLFFLGGDIIRDFAFALIIGVLIGTYSSIFVASPILLFWRQKSALS